MCFGFGEDMILLCCVPPNGKMRSECHLAAGADTIFVFKKQNNKPFILKVYVWWGGG